jgi:DNA-binding transcriptional ArsR family regulator
MTSLAQPPDYPPLLASSDGLEVASQILVLLANRNRLHILCLLVHKGELSVGDLNKCVHLSQSALSQHLAILREGGLVGARREAQTVYYRIVREDVNEIVKTLHRLYCKNSLCQ